MPGQLHLSEPFTEQRIQIQIQNILFSGMEISGQVYFTPVGRGVQLGSFWRGYGVRLCSPNPDPISDQNMSFFVLFFSPSL